MLVHHRLAQDCINTGLIALLLNWTPYSLLTPELLDQLRVYWRACRSGAKGDDWLFASRCGPSRPRKAAGITKAGGIHSLRHCFASHLLEGPGMKMYYVSRSASASA